MLTLISPDGTVGDRLPITLEEMRRLYSDMVEARTYDHKCMAMQRQGRLATYAPFEGQEAAQIGAAAALRPDDWVAATYRDAALMWRAGYPWSLLVAGRTGDERGGHASRWGQRASAFDHRRRSHDPCRRAGLGRGAQGL